MTISPVPALNITGAGNALLNTAVAVIEAAGVITLPTSVGFVPGAQVAFDGPQFTVNWMGIGFGEPGTEDNRPVLPFQLMVFYQFELMLLRKVTTVDGLGDQGGAPMMASLASDAQTINTDAGQLLAAAVTMHAEGLIVPVGIPFQYGPMSSIGPEGGLAGSRLPVNFQAGVTDFSGY